jgi:hypothetical protein
MMQPARACLVPPAQLGPAGGQVPDASDSQPGCPIPVREGEDGRTIPCTRDSRPWYRSTLSKFNFPSCFVSWSSRNLDLGKFVTGLRTANLFQPEPKGCLSGTEEEDVVLDPG